MQGVRSGKGHRQILQEDSWLLQRCCKSSVLNCRRITERRQGMRRELLLGKGPLFVCLRAQEEGELYKQRCQLLPEKAT